MILIQPCSPYNSDHQDTIFRLKHSDMKLPIDEDESDLLDYYIGNKKPPMPDLPTPILPDNIAMHKLASTDRARELDFQFLNDMYTSPNCAEYSGYNTKVCREQGYTLQPKTKVVYLPLIDKDPADPTTIMAALVKAQAVTETTGQEYVVFTADQQLYRVAVHVMWENQARFNNVYIRLGGMHLLMSYVGCIGSLMAGSGIVEVLSEVY